MSNLVVSHVLKLYLNLVEEAQQGRTDLVLPVLGRQVVDGLEVVGQLFELDIEQVKHLEGHLADLSGLVFGVLGRMLFRAVNYVALVAHVLPAV